MLRPTFCGLSVIGWKSSMGWGPNQTSTLTVDLVRDPANGDSPQQPPVGTPVYFQFFAFRFFGLLQKFTESNTPGGMPVWRAVCVDPREVLEGTQVILGHYNGPVYGVRNVLNAYGWHENQFGFGAARVNESGMPWNLAKAAIVSLSNTPAVGTYGGALNYRGFNYALDLSELPVPPDDYRVGGVSSGLLELVAAICEDGGYDFFVDLEGFVIRVRTVSRRTEPPLGTIYQVVNTNTGNVLRNEDGLEARNETTSAFIVGGDVCGVYEVPASDMRTFWGYDAAGNAILGEPGTLQLRNQQGNVIGTFDTEFVDLNAAGVADVLGSLTYRTTTLELRLALVNYETWSSYVWNHRPDVRPLVYSPFKNQGGIGLQVKPNVVNDGADAARQASMAAINSDFVTRSQRIYEFVRSYASDYYGKKFVAAVPFVSAKQDAETLRVDYSMEPAEGGWQEGAPPLGLSDEAVDTFSLPDGRFRPFVRYAGLQGMDLGRVSPADSAAENGRLYLRANADRQLLFIGGRPFVLLSLGSAVHDEAVSPVGDVGIVTAVLGMQPNQAGNILNGSFGNVGVKVWPKARYPESAAVALKSNVLCYGPWYRMGAPGKVRYENDPSMVPWNYGGLEVMNQAALARVALATTEMQVSETGALELAGTPLASLGDVLQPGGPNVTNIEVSYGKDGYTTSYRFQTFTPKFGVFSKNTADRLKKLGLTQMELRKAVRAKTNEASAAAEASDNALRGFLANAAKAVKRETPHEVLCCHVEKEKDEQGNVTAVRVCPMSLTYEEAVGMARGDDAEGYKRTAVMSLDGLVRPFAAAQDAGDGMPYPGTPDNTLGANAATLSPFKTGNDVSYLAWGAAYSRLHSYEAGNDPDTTRALALRGPLWVAGYGHDVRGRPVPGDGDGNWRADYLRRSDLWKVGPVDLLYDDRRKVWTPHANYSGVASGDIPANGTGVVVVTDEGGEWPLPVSNIWSTAVAGGQRVFCVWEAARHRSVVIAADCVP